MVTLHDGRGIKGNVAKERAKFGSFVLFFGKKLQDWSRKNRMRVPQEPKKDRERSSTSSALLRDKTPAP